MKKLLALLLAAFLLLPTVTAFAEEPIYIRELPQYRFVNTKLLTEESYPEVRLTPVYPGRFFTSYNRQEAVFLCFPGPEGALCESFDSDEAEYIDETNAIQYVYREEESDSFEEFLNLAKADEYILLDGSDGVAAYIDPVHSSAHGLISTKEFGKSSKLRIYIFLHGLDSRMPESERISRLTEAIMPEVERVADQMHYETMEPYWNCGEFAGAKLLEYTFQTLCVVDFPTLDWEFEGKYSRRAPLIVTSLGWASEGSSITGIYDYSEGNYLEAEVEFSTFSYPQAKLKEGNKDTYTVTLDNGSEWCVFYSYVNNDGTISSWYASKTLEGLQSEYGQQFYLSLRINCNNQLRWTNAQCLKALESWDAGIRIIPAEDDPYVPPKRPEPTPEEPAEPAPDEPEGPAVTHEPAPGGWTCPKCGEENTGNFCSNCGTARPEPTKWTCPKCGQENNGNFCPNCGTAKPA